MDFGRASEIGPGKSRYPRDVAEMALAHSIENKVEAAYRRGDLFEKRRLMMSDWSRYVDPLEPDFKTIGYTPVSNPHQLAHYPP